MAKLTKTLLAQADKAGREAAKKATPIPMVVSDGTRQWYVEGGVCGFGWVHFPDARSAAVKFLKKHNIGHSDYPRGWAVSSALGTQSLELNRTYAVGYSKFLRDKGFECYAKSRID